LSRDNIEKILRDKLLLTISKRIINRSRSWKNQYEIETGSKKNVPRPTGTRVRASTVSCHTRLRAFMVGKTQPRLMCDLARRGTRQVTRLLKTKISWRPRFWCQDVSPKLDYPDTNLRSYGWFIQHSLTFEGFNASAIAEGLKS
jgi:hypothetical protein